MLDFMILVYLTILDVVIASDAHIREICFYLKKQVTSDTFVDSRSIETRIIDEYEHSKHAFNKEKLLSSLSIKIRSRLQDECI